MENNYVPEIYVGDNGNWFVNGYDTGTKAQGEPGKDGITPHIGADGFWYIGEMNTGVKAQGEMGPKGDKGEPGATGPQGLTGATGPQGFTGPQGPTGATGPQGMTGPKGDTGVAGPQGTQGLQGPKGDTGAQGILGPKGDKGDIGTLGPQGPKGDTGNQGLQGCQGLKGDKGDAGARGSEGPQGKQGIQGIPGPVNLANNLTTTTAGYGLDARQGKALMNEVDKVNSKLILSTSSIVPTSNIRNAFNVYKNGNVVTLAAYFKVNTAMSAGTTYTIGNLPKNYIPLSLMFEYGMCGTVPVVFSINTSGTITIQPISANLAYDNWIYKTITYVVS